MAGNYIYSLPISVVRYKNGTLLKLSADTHEFKSYNYDVEKKTGTFNPSSITITAKLDGDISIGRWLYSTSGSGWTEVESGKHGMTINGDRLTLAATSDLYATSNSNITIKCEADSDGYFDTVTIARTIDPIITYSKVYADLKVESDKISMIASDENIASYRESQDYREGKSLLDFTAHGITSTVSETYATFDYADSAANTAVNDLFVTGGRLNGYTTLVETVASLEQTSTSIQATVSSHTNSISALQNDVKDSIVSDTIYYWANDKESGVRVDSPDAKWTDNAASADAKLTAEKKYLWLYHHYTYKGADSRNTTPVIGGVYGDKGATGGAGTNGINTATIVLYKRGTSSPTKPTATLTYTFATASLSGNLNGWTTSIPSGTAPCWAIAATASSNAASDTITASEWSAQTKIVQDGMNGLNQATIRLYRRATTTPSKPTATPVYTFATGTLSSVPSGWSTSVPNGTAPCYTTSAAAISADATYTITAWSDVTKLVEDGGKGDKGDQGSTGVGVTEVATIYYVTAKSQVSQVPAPTSSVDRTDERYDTWTRGIPKVTETYKYMYTCDQIKYDNGGSPSWTPVVLDSAMTDVSDRLRQAELQITDSAIISTVTDTTAGKAALASVIEQNASSIRMQADTITWQATNSSMNENGTLTCTGAHINGLLEVKTLDREATGEEAEEVEEMEEFELEYDLQDIARQDSLLRLGDGRLMICDTGVGTNKGVGEMMVIDNNFVLVSENSYNIKLGVWDESLDDFKAYVSIGSNGDLTLKANRLVLDDGTIFTTTGYTGNFTFVDNVDYPSMFTVYVQNGIITDVS